MKFNQMKRVYLKLLWLKVLLVLNVVDPQDSQEDTIKTSPIKGEEWFRVLLDQGG